MDKTYSREGDYLQIVFLFVELELDVKTFLDSNLHLNSRLWAVGSTSEGSRCILWIADYDVKLFDYICLVVP